jgi:hypothetical protein
MEARLKKTWIKEIEIGPRPILIGLEMDDVGLTQVVLSSITRQCMRYGQARLNDIVEALSTENHLRELDVLQMIFGFVHELKIRFYHNNQPVTALETKKILMKDPDTDIRVILNKQVPASVFLAVQQVFESMDDPLGEYTDQHGFAFAVLNRIKQWHTDLKTWYTRSTADGYPGSRRISELIAFTEKLLVNQTAHALLTSCFEQARHLTTAAQDIRKIQGFYTKDLAFWDQVKQTLPGFRENLDRMENDPDIGGAYDELTEIFNTPDPFDQIQKARDLFDTVTACHLQIEARKLEACRQNAKERIDKVIQQLTPKLSAHPVDMDMQNRILLTLRQVQKQISGLPDIGQVKQVCQDTIDLTLDQVEDLTGIHMDI